MIFNEVCRREEMDLPKKKVEPASSFLVYFCYHGNRVLVLRFIYGKYCKNTRTSKLQIFLFMNS